MRRLRRAARILLLAAAAGCSSVPLHRPATRPGQVQAELAAQDTLVASRFIRYQARLMAVAARIRLANVDLCGRDVGSFLGIYAVPVTLEAAPGRVSAHPAGRPVMEVVFVLPGSPAERAGIRFGDQILATGGRPARRPADVEVAEVPPSAAPLPVRLLRGDSLQTVPVEPVAGCDYPVTLAWSHVLEGLAASSGVSVTTGMMRFVESDDELAQVLGHEFAHEIPHHHQLSARLRLELDADYLGCYLAARAGYPVSRAPEFLRRFAAEWVNTEAAPLEMRARMAERIVALDAAAREIQRRQRSGEALTP